MCLAREQILNIPKLYLFFFKDMLNTVWIRKISYIEQYNTNFKSKLPYICDIINCLTIFFSFTKYLYWYKFVKVYVSYFLRHCCLSTPSRNQFLQTWMVCKKSLQEGSKLDNSTVSYKCRRIFLLVDQGWKRYLAK